MKLILRGKMLKGKLVGLRRIETDDLKQLLAWRNQPSFRQYFREHRELGPELQEEWYNKTVLTPGRFRQI